MTTEYQEGRFNGMEDIYEYDNRNSELPQVKFVFVENHFDPELKQAAWDWLRNRFGGMEDAPADYNDAGQFRFHNEWGNTLIHRALSGAIDGFWLTQEKRAA